MRCRHGIYVRLTYSDKNQKILGHLGIIRTLQAFFLPMRTGSNTVWNFEILLRVLKIFDNVIKLCALSTSLLHASRA